MKQRKKVQLVEVEWLDADCDSGWLPDDPEADEQIEYMKAYGLLVSKGKTFTVLSFLYDKHANQWLGKQRIPSNWIKSIRVIEEIKL